MLTLNQGGIYSVCEKTNHSSVSLKKMKKRLPPYWPLSRGRYSKEGEVFKANSTIHFCYFLYLIEADFEKH